MSRPTDIFRDSGLQGSYERDGYAKFPLLNAKQCNALSLLYKELKSSLSFNNGLHISVDMAPLEIKKKLREQIMEQIGHGLETIFTEFEYPHCGFIIKTANSVQSSIGVHQDWTFVPEEEGFSSGTLWIAINDVPKARGGIGFIPGSHRWADHFRYTPREVAYNPFDAHRELILPYMEYEDLKAGEAILWDHRVLHASPPNTTDQDRLVIAFSIMPKQAQIQLHWQLAENGNVGVFEVDAPFYLRHTAADLHQCFLDGKAPEGLRPIRTYRPTEKVRVSDVSELRSDEHGFEITSLRLTHRAEPDTHAVIFSENEDMFLEMAYCSEKPNVHLGMTITDFLSNRLMDDSPKYHEWDFTNDFVGKFTAKWVIPKRTLNPGRYYIDLYLVTDEWKVLKHFSQVLEFKVEGRDALTGRVAQYRAPIGIDLGLQFNKEA